MHKRWTLARRPQGLPVPADFATAEAPAGEPGEGQILVRIAYVSVDPGMRSRLSTDSYAPALKPGETIESAGLGRVVASRNPKFKEGDIVSGGFGWQTHALVDGRGVSLLDPALYSGVVKPTYAIGVLGVPGLTAYFGLKSVGAAKSGETVLISSAAGPVGATAGQLARAWGLTPIGIAGGQAKCEWLNTIGFAYAIDYRAGGDLTEIVRIAAPKGVDIYFDNVGGDMLDAAILTLNLRGRIVVSGQVSEYNRESPHGIRHVTAFITKRLRMEGLVVYDFAREFPAARAEMAEMIRAGTLTVREEIFDGFEATPEAFIGLFKHENFGRRLVKFGEL